MVRRLVGLLVIALLVTPVRADEADDTRRAIDNVLTDYRNRVDQTESRYRAKLLGKLQGRNGKPVPEGTLFRVLRLRQAQIEREQATVARLFRSVRAEQTAAGIFGHKTDEIFVAATLVVWDVTLDEVRQGVRLIRQQYSDEADELRKMLSNGGASVGGEVKKREQALRATTSAAFRELASQIGAAQRSLIAEVKRWGESAKRAGRPNAPSLTGELISEDLSLTTSGGFPSVLDTFLHQQSIVLTSIVLPESERLSLKDALTSQTATPNEKVRELDFLLNRPAFRFVSGIHPLKPVSGAPVTLGFRLRNLPDYQVRDVVLNLNFDTVVTDDDDKEKLEPLETIETDDERCKAAGEGAFTCQLGDIKYGQHVDLVFRATLPVGGIHWLATWDTKDGVAHGMAADVFEPDDTPRILDVILLGGGEEKLQDQYELPTYPYPFGPGVRGPKYRTLFLVGRGLPQRGDPFETTSVDPNVSYHFVAWPDGEHAKAYYKEYYARGWELYRREVGLEGDAPLPDGLQGLLVRAAFVEGILPGAKEFALNEGPAAWTLRFGGLHATVNFVRNHVERRPLQDAYLPDRVRVSIETTRELPLETIPVTIFEEDRRGNRAPHKLTATRSPTNPRVFLTPPIDLVERGRPHMAVPPSNVDGALVIDVDYGNGTPTKLLAEVDPEFRSLKFYVPCNPPVATVSVLRGPADGKTNFLFKSALTRAAACARKPVHNWDELTASEAETLRNYLILKIGPNVASAELPDPSKHVLKTEVKIGHHAAMLLLRDTFAEMLKEQVPRLNKLATSRENALGILAYMSTFWRGSDETFPINLIEVKDPNGGTTTFGKAVAIDDLPYLMKEYGKDEEEIKAWRLEATREALKKLGDESIRLRDEVLALDPCEVADLLLMTGRGFGAVVERLKPRLMKLKEEEINKKKYLYWEPDRGALGWLVEVEPLGEQYRRNRQRARRTRR